MNKKTQMLLGVALLAGVGFYLWKQSQKPKATFTKAFGGDEAMSLGSETVEGCPCKKVLYQQKDVEGRNYNICDDQSACPA